MQATQVLTLVAARPGGILSDVASRAQGVNGLYVFTCVFCYIPYKEGEESPWCRLTSRLISCSSIVLP